MSRDRVDRADPVAVELTEIDPPPQHVGGPWDPHVQPIDPNPPANAEPPVARPVDIGAVDAGPVDTTGLDDASSPPLATARRRRIRLLPHTLTGRLVTGVVALVALIVILTGSATYFALQAFLLTRLDQQVQTAANGRLDRLFAPAPPATGTSTVRSPQEVWAVALDASGAVITQPSNTSVNAMMLSNDDRSALSKRSLGSPVTVTTSNGVRLRVVTHTATATDVTTGVSESAIAVVGLSTDEMTTTLHRLLLVELAIGAGAILLAFFATSYGVRLSLRPLRRVTRTAQEVTAELSPEGAGLDRRVPVTDTDTEVGQVAESVNTLLGAVESQFAARVQSEDRMRQFLADASHELRTPLTSIRGYAELSRMRRTNGSIESDAAESHDADTLNRIESEGTRMSRLVEDLLLLARSDQGASPHREPVSLGELISDAVDGVHAAYPERRIEAVVPTPVVVEGDRDQLLRVLRNLITNAAVHTPAPGPIGVSAYAIDGGAVLEVADSGPGLPPEEAAHVFERFWRADKARTRARGGTGLGLAIVSSIVQAHGGAVTFDSSMDAGSTVRIRLPASTPDS